MRKLKNILAGMVLIVLIGLGLWYFFVVRDTPGDRSSRTDISATTTQEDSIPATSEEEIIIPDWYAYDKDGDGVEDTKETELGTNLYESDSDFDGLTDEVELNQYGSDPTKPDTDGDGFWDGLEVISGYNPAGEGKLR